MRPRHEKTKHPTLKLEYTDAKRKIFFYRDQGKSKRLIPEAQSIQKVTVTASKCYDFMKKFPSGILNDKARPEM